MNNDRLKDLNKKLWNTADELRANTGLKASEYATPVKGRIFLKFADSNDIFGEVYEYFLGNFALKEGQGGGEFFTPWTVVQYMV